MSSYSFKIKLPTNYSLKNHTYEHIYVHPGATVVVYVCVYE